MGCASVLFGTLTVLRITSSYPINISFSHPKAAFLVILSENRKFARWKSISGGSNNAGKLIYSLSCVYWGEWTKEHSRLCDWANWQIGCKANAIKHVWIAEPQPMFSKKKKTHTRVYLAHHYNPILLFPHTFHSKHFSIIKEFSNLHPK